VGHRASPQPGIDEAAAFDDRRSVTITTVGTPGRAHGNRHASDSKPCRIDYLGDSGQGGISVGAEETVDHAADLGHGLAVAEPQGGVRRDEHRVDRIGRSLSRQPGNRTVRG
jgi:hypothetical protein